MGNSTKSQCRSDLVGVNTERSRIIEKPQGYDSLCEGVHKLCKKEEYELYKELKSLKNEKDFIYFDVSDIVKNDNAFAKMEIFIFRLCPYCKKLCSRNQTGCKHVKCNGCGKSFCFVCLRTPSGDQRWFYRDNNKWKCCGKYYDNPKKQAHRFCEPRDYVSFQKSFKSLFCCIPIMKEQYYWYFPLQTKKNEFYWYIPNNVPIYSKLRDKFWKEET